MVSGCLPPPLAGPPRHFPLSCGEAMGSACPQKVPAASSSSCHHNKACPAPALSWGAAEPHRQGIWVSDPLLSPEHCRVGVQTAHVLSGVARVGPPVFVLIPFGFSVLCSPRDGRGCVANVISPEDSRDDQASFVSPQGGRGQKLRTPWCQSNKWSQRSESKVPFTN